MTMCSISDSEVDWTCLPDIVLGNIFHFLPTPDKLCIGEVCSSWNSAMCRPEVWQSFEFSEKDIEEFGNGLDLLKSELFFSDLEGNIQESLTDVYVNSIQQFGKHFKHVNILYRGRNSSRILHTISNNCSGIKYLKIQRLLQNVQVVQNHDSSHKQAVQNIIQKNTRLEYLEVRDIDNYAVSQQKDPLPIGAMHSYSLQKLYINQSFQASNLGNLMYLVNLRELAMEPHLMSYSLLYHLAGRALTDLHIVAISKHMEFYNENLQDWQWKEIKKQGPDLRVHCHFGVGQEWTEKEIILKKEMPLKCLKYAKFDLLKYTLLSGLVCNYSATLVEFIDFSMFSKSYKIAQGNKTDRKQINGCIYKIVATCSHLRLLSVKEVLFSQTVLAMLSKNMLLEILLRADQIEYTEHTAGDLILSPEHKELVQSSWRTQQTFSDAVRELTGKSWMFFTDTQLHSTLLKSHLKFY